MAWAAFRDLGGHVTQVGQTGDRATQVAAPAFGDDLAHLTQLGVGVEGPLRGEGRFVGHLGMLRTGALGDPPQQIGGTMPHPTAGTTG